MTAQTRTSVSRPRAHSQARAPSRIYDAALAEFALHGIDGARIDEIVRRAGVSKQLFYYYFNSKEEIYELVLERTSEQAINSILGQDYDSMSPEAAIIHFLRSVFDQYLEMPFLVKFTTDQDCHRNAHITARNKLRSLTPEIVALVARILKRGQANGVFISGVDPAFFYSATLLMLRGCFVSSCTVALLPTVSAGDVNALHRWREDCIAFALSGVYGSRPAGYDDRSLDANAPALDLTISSFGLGGARAHLAGCQGQT